MEFRIISIQWALLVIALNESNSTAFVQLKMTIIPPLIQPRFNSPGRAHNPPGRAHNHKPSDFVNNLRTFSSFQKLPLNIYKSVSASRVATKLRKRLRLSKTKLTKISKQFTNYGCPREGNLCKVHIFLFVSLESFNFSREKSSLCKYNLNFIHLNLYLKFFSPQEWFFFFLSLLFRLFWYIWYLGITLLGLRIM